MNTMTPIGVSHQGFTCETGIRKLLSRIEFKPLKIESAAQSNSVITDSEAQLGQLLVRTGLLSEKALAACLSYASIIDVPLGAVLRLSRLVSDDDIDRAIYIQQEIRSGLSPTIARVVLRYASLVGVSAPEALRAFSMSDQISPLDCWLSLILPSSEILTESEFQDLRAKANAAKKNWFKYAVEHDIVSIDVLSAAMHAVVLLDHGHVAFDDAATLLRAVHENQGNLMVLLRGYTHRHCFDADTVNLVALLYMSGALSERNALDVLSVSYRSRINPVTLLKEHRLVSETQFHQALNASLLMKQGLHYRSNPHRITQIKPIAC